MDFLNRAYAQLYDRYRSMTPGSRLTAGLLAIVVLLSLGYLFTHQTAGPDVDLMHGVPLTAAELRTMEAALGKAKLQYEIRGSSILVPHGQEASCMAALSDGNALPKQCGELLRTALNSTGLWEDHRLTEEKAKIALQDVLAQAIGEMPGIEQASVLYDVDNKPGFNKEKVARAIAFVKSVGANPLSEAQVAAIRQAIGGGAVAGLKPENVTVADISGGRTWCPNAENGGSGGEENPYLAVQRAYEQALRTKILGALCYIPNVTVEVSVVLDRERSTHIRQDRRSSGDERSAGGGPVRGHGKAAPPERPAAVAQQPNTAAALNALLGGGRSDDETQEAGAADIGSHEHVEKESVGLTPLQARVSVAVPASYFKNIWQARNPVEPGRPAAKPDAVALERLRTECSLMIKNHVAGLLPLPETAAKAAELVTVTTFQDIPIQEPPPPDFNETLVNWLRRSWTTLGMIALALLSLLVLRSIMRGLPPPQVQTMAVSAERLDQLDADVIDKTDDNVESRIPRPHARRFDGAGSPLREELAELVATDPDAAVNVLRNWIGSVE